MRTVLAASTVLMTLGCTNAATSSAAPSTPAPVTAWRNVSAGTIAGDEPVPTPPADPVLSISGLISNTNDGGELVADLATLEQMPLGQLEVVEPFENRTMVFEGVLMSDLAEIAGVDARATEAHFTALDDYEFTIPLEEIRSKRVLLATSAEGEPMSVEEGGPIRIIFPPDSEFGRNTDAWIWSVTTIDFR
ncbi:MAG TPA: molybdopterin-dependent oxidoreductase [Euzebyales bacterium]|nr:molybdopterin-dependent oxidoreductase [Euzebyales bacterium]